MNLFYKEEGLFRRECAMVLQAQGNVEEAAKMLQIVNYGDNDAYNERVDDALTLAEWWFDLDDSTQAEIFVNRARHIVHNVEDRILQLRFKQSNIKLNDSKREFLLAAQGYYNLCLVEGLEVDESADLLNKAIVCTILSPAGPRKARHLIVLMKDERAKLNPFFELLQKMTLGYIIKAKDTADFE